MSKGCVWDKDAQRMTVRRHGVSLGWARGGREFRQGCDGDKWFIAGGYKSAMDMSCVRSQGRPPQAGVTGRGADRSA